jgi:hypothetical protein
METLRSSAKVEFFRNRNEISEMSKLHVLDDSTPIEGRQALIGESYQTAGNKYWTPL